MSDTTDATPWHESIRAFRARGGQPADHPACALLTEVAGRIRWVATDRERAAAEEWLARTPRSATDRRLEANARWTVELLSDRELADWFIDGLDDATVRREEERALDAWDRAARPWAAEVIPVRRGFRCDISGRTDRVVALRLTPRRVPDRDEILLDVGAVMSICTRGMDDLEAALQRVLHES